MMPGKVTVGVIGLWLMARYHLQQMLKQTESARIEAVWKPALENYVTASDLFRNAGFEPPPNIPDFRSHEWPGRPYRMFLEPFNAIGGYICGEV